MKKKSESKKAIPPSRRREISEPECEYCKILQVQRFIEGAGSEIDFVEDNFISVDAGMWQIIVDEGGLGEFWVDFHVNVDPGISASIIENLSKLSSSLNMKIRIGESYAYEFDENGDFVEMTFGDDAYKTVGRDPFEIFGN